MNRLRAETLLIKIPLGNNPLPHVKILLTTSHIKPRMEGFYPRGLSSEGVYSDLDPPKMNASSFDVDARNQSHRFTLVKTRGFWNWEWIKRYLCDSFSPNSIIIKCFCINTTFESRTVSRCFWFWMRCHMSMFSVPDTMISSSRWKKDPIVFLNSASISMIFSSVTICGRLLFGSMSVMFLVTLTEDYLSWRGKTAPCR